MGKILIINGPNLNWVGKREPEVYGSESLEVYLNGLGSDIEIIFTNLEGVIIDALQRAEESLDVAGVIINAGGYSHTSVAISDTIRAMNKPVIAVHISNIFNREELRHRDLIAAASKGFIGGFGLDSYRFGLEALRVLLNKNLQ